MTIRSFILFSLLPAVCCGQLDFEREPINYSDSTPTDKVHQLSQKLVDGTVTLQWDAEHGYLKSLLQELDVTPTSQTLVFSRTSLQVSRISPRRPRAIYFNDDVYVGWVQQGDVIELSAADPQLGGTFYSLSQQPSNNPQIKQENARCLQCHASTHTRRTPGHMVRSVTSDAAGQPVYKLGTHVTEPRSPFSERFGGWYVTGTHGSQRHMGNSWLADPDASEILDTEAGANLTDLSPMVNVSPYLTAHSDIVALLVLQHQVHMHNVLTAANHSGRLTARDAVVMNKVLERDEGFESDSTFRRYESAARRVVDGLLFKDEILLTDTICGSNEFSEQFAARGPFDNQKRSLRQFDLQQRLFKYPCSFLIYADSFKALPEGVMSNVRRMLEEVLTAENTNDDYSHLSLSDRKAIHEILSETLWADFESKTAH